MKFLLLLLVGLLGVWLWRSARGRAEPHEKDEKQEERRSSPAAAPQDMVACALCGLHVPHGDALPGQRGSYCCAEHRQQAEP